MTWRAPVLFVVVDGLDETTAAHVREVVGRPHLVLYRGAVRYWAEDSDQAEREVAVLALAGIRGRIEYALGGTA